MTRWSATEELLLPEFGGWAAAHLMKQKLVKGWTATDLSPLQVRKLIFDEVYRWLAKDSKHKTVRITDSIIRSANKNELDPILILAMVIQESGMRTNAKGKDGEIGLLQLKVGTARWIAKRNGQRLPLRQDLFNPDTNLALGTAYLAFLRDRLGHAYFIHAYNRGPTGMRRKKGDYLKRVTRHYQNLMAALTVTDVHGFASLEKHVQTKRSHPLVTLIGSGQGKSPRVP